MKHNLPDMSPIKDLVISNKAEICCEFFLERKWIQHVCRASRKQTRVLVSSTECYPKNPQGTFNDVVKTLEFALKQPLGSMTITHPIN